MIEIAAVTAGDAKVEAHENRNEINTRNGLLDIRKIDQFSEYKCVQHQSAVRPSDAAGLQSVASHNPALSTRKRATPRHASPGKELDRRHWQSGSSSRSICHF
jgi:hypothetical protein